MSVVAVPPPMFTTRIPLPSTYAIRAPSGAHDACSPSMSAVSLEPSALMRYTVPARSNATRFPSGDQAGFSPWTRLVIDVPSPLARKIRAGPRGPGGVIGDDGVAGDVGVEGVPGVAGLFGFAACSAGSVGTWLAHAA